MVTATVDGGLGGEDKEQIGTWGKIPLREQDDWCGGYAFMNRLDFVAPCKRSGYDGKLPQPIVRSGR